MMQCEEVLDRLNAWVDGELPAEDAVRLDAHLAECPQCRAAAEAVQAIGTDLRGAFTSRRDAAARLAESVVSAIRASASERAGPIAMVREASAPQVAPPLRLGWGQLLLAMAAGFLLAVVLMRTWQPRSVVPAPFSSSSLPPASLPPLQPIAHLAVASGQVETRSVSQMPFFGCSTSAPIKPDSVVRTGPTARCELSLEDGNALRLDCNTEVTLHQSAAVEVNRGRLWASSQPGNKGLEIKSGGGTILTGSPSQVAVDCQPHAVRLIVLDGAVNVRTSRQSLDVGPGKQMRIVEGKVEEDPELRDALLETAWVNSVLALRGPEHPELVDRVHQLLANVGAAKLSLLYEDELRRLGDGGVPPLLAYLASTRDTPKVSQRTTAARIVSDVAQPRWIADLIELLTDPNADVRFHAARGLERLTGRNQGCEPQVWQSEPWVSCEGAHEKWLSWWAANRDRYPTARREISAPPSPPF
jgi:hypothetical protein